MDMRRMPAASVARCDGKYGGHERKVHQEPLT